MRIVDDSGQTLRTTRAENISDGGAFLTMPIDALPPFGGELDVAFSVPRTTANTYMLEEFTCKARVVRHQPLKDSDRAGMALRFAKPQKLMLVV